MGKIHYATGGLITPEKSEFGTLCGRKFAQGHSEIMQSGYSGAKNVTCEDCRWLLDIQEYKKEHIYYRVKITDGMYSQSFFTLEEAEKELKDMRSGYPRKNDEGSEYSNYWKKLGKRAFIIKCVDSEKFVKN